MTNTSKYTMNDIPSYREPKGFMLITTGKMTEKVAQDIGKDRFNKDSDKYLELGLKESDFKMVNLDDLKNMTEVDRVKQLKSQKVIIFLVENEASFNDLHFFQEEIATVLALTFSIVLSTINEINSFNTEPKNALRDKVSTLLSIPTFAVPFITLQAKNDFTNDVGVESYKFYFSFADLVVTLVCTVYRQDDSMIGYDFNDWKKVFGGNRLLTILPSMFTSKEDKSNLKSEYLEGLGKIGINLNDIENIICVMSANSPVSLGQVTKVIDAIDNDFAIFCTTTMRLTQDLAVFEDPSVISVNVIVSKNFEDV